VEKFAPPRSERKQQPLKLVSILGITRATKNPPIAERVLVLNRALNQSVFRHLETVPPTK
jgi:hypothetical protein